jgi:Flp pilus assembly protein TadG
MSRFHSQRRRGSALIEFALWLPIMMLMLAGLLDLSWYMATSQNVMQAARDGARTGAAKADDPGTLGTNESVDAAIAATDWIKTTSPYGCADTVASEGSRMGMDTLEVTVTCNYVPLLGTFSNFMPTQISYRFLMFDEVQ